MLDTKTRWSSLHAMLERFLKLKNCTRKSLIDLQSKIVITDEEFDTISSVVQVQNNSFEHLRTYICCKYMYPNVRDVKIKFLFLKKML